MTLKTHLDIDYSAIEEYVGHGDVSELEGWLLAQRSDDGALAICRYEADPHGHFATDAEAASYVLWRAVARSDFHQEVFGVVGVPRSYSVDIVRWSHRSIRNNPIELAWNGNALSRGRVIII
ncbi:hypothetical protein IVA98_27080 [Bradyrhizobium sp. 160]|uniref:hypothetical protein n=1 Tax=Bradyrhizobium sp. 160 TaxID=2782634 RepID=UPI001FFA33C9|nr:hypothetical protein [Bradyrhizobium sp. 160]MCK1626751.1 hypothetical protein [Bradyrhizobium sp. 160]